MFRVLVIALVLSGPLALSGCAVANVTGAVVGTTAKAGWYVTKGTAKLAYKGTKAGVNLARGRKVDGTPRGYDGDGRGPDVACPPDRVC